MDLKYILSHFFSHTKENEIQFKKTFSLLLNKAFSFIHNKENDPLHGHHLPNEVSQIFREQNIPNLGQNLESVLNEALEQIVQNSVRLSHPNYIGHMTQACPNFNLLCDFIISFLNQNTVKIETALSATYIEWQTLSWVHKLIYKQSDNFYNHILNQSDASLGNMCSGGTVANLTALIVARNKAFPSLHKVGLFESFQQEGVSRAVILVSTRGHYSIKKAAAIIGLGEQNVLAIPCEPYTNKINLDELKKTIQSLKESQVKIICLVGLAGSTETGSIDDLESLSQICFHHKIWFHVDAAWGGALLFSDKHQSQLSGIQNADSVSIDGHKFLYLSISHSLVLFKNQTSLNSVRHSANYIIREGSVDLGRTSIEGSRRFDSFKLWFALKILGRTGYNTLINEAIEKGRLFYELISQQEDFETTSAYFSGILTYRFIPKKLKLELERAKKNKNLFSESVKINLLLNKINIEIQKKQRANGKSFVSRTSLESFFQGQEIVVLRALPFNPLTNLNILAEILMEQFELGHSILAGE